MTPAIPEPPAETMIDRLFAAGSKARLSKREREFLEFCKTTEGPATLPWFRKWWDSLSEDQQNNVKFAYIFKR